MPYFAYIMASHRNGTLYVGVTNNLVWRVFEHREGRVDGFTRDYDVKMLVYYEQFEDVRDAIQRERNLKHWSRDWKVALIEGQNPNWHDLSENLFG